MPLETPFTLMVVSVKGDGGSGGGGGDDVSEFFEQADKTRITHSDNIILFIRHDILKVKGCRLKTALNGIIKS
jgi:hypothetical protein